MIIALGSGFMLEPFVVKLDPGDMSHGPMSEKTLTIPSSRELVVLMYTCHFRVRIELAVGYLPYPKNS